MQGSFAFFEDCQMRRLNKYCIKRCQPKMSWNPKNCFNISQWQPINERNLNIFQIEWKCKSLGRLYYNGDVTNTIFKRTYEKNSRNMHDTLVAMEHRLDNVVFRSMFSSSVFSARKMISEGLVLVNGRRVLYPDYRIKKGDLVQIDSKSTSKVESLANHPYVRLWAFIPSYLEVSFSSFSAILVREPTLNEIPSPFPRKLIDNMGSFYSKR